MASSARRSCCAPGGQKRTLGLLGLLIAAVSPPAFAQEPAPGENRPLEKTNYEIRARLESEQHLLRGKVRIAFTNRSLKPQAELYFHAYLNAFESDETLYLRKRVTPEGGAERGGRNGDVVGQRGSLAIKSLRMSERSEEDLWTRAEAHTPGDEKDRTDIRVPLPQPIAVNERVLLELDFDAKLPEIVERTGYAGDFYLVAQWFPKLARLEPDGSWAHFPFHPYAEFYADFGDYDVTLDVPEKFIVGSTGSLKEERHESGRRYYRATARDVVDFAWTAWPDFEVSEDRIGNVAVRVLLPRTEAGTKEVTWTTLRQALPYFSEKYGSYPYETLTVVSPPAAARRAGGMEYPTFITTGSSPFFSQLGVRWIELVTAHELAHQWFMGLLASNEAAFPMLDEGLTSSAEWRFLEAEYGSGSLFQNGPVTLHRVAAGRYAALIRPLGDPSNRPASAFSSFGSLSRSVYARTPLVLETLRRRYGDPLFDRALLNYATAQRFRHPTPEDFFSALEETLGVEARKFAEIALGTTVPLAQSLALRSTATPHRIALEVRQSPKLSWPIELRIDFVDGSFETILLARSGTITPFILERTKAMSRIILDPRSTLLTDGSFFDNRILVDGDPGAPRFLRNFVRIASALLRSL